MKNKIDRIKIPVSLEPAIHNYRLVRERDGLTKTSMAIKWLEFDEECRYKADFQSAAIGRSLIMSPFNIYFTWQTTPVTEILEEKDNYIRFRTENSIYELFKE
jgi:hypothetical protein